MKMYFIRHGETTSDIEDRYGGTYDDHLTSRGQEQLKTTAAKLVGKGIEIIFCSPLMRAQESGRIIANAIGAPIECIAGLQERHYGILTGLTKEEANQKYPDVVHQHENPLNTDPEGESYDEFYSRVESAFKSILQTNYKTIALVSHGGPIKCMLRMLRQNIPDKLGDGEILEIELDIK